MKSKWTRLLVAIDGSSPSIRAFEHSLRIVPKSDLELMILLHVYKVPTPLYFSSQAEFRTRLDLSMRNQIKGWIRPILEHEYKEDIDLIFEMKSVIKLETLASNSTVSELIVDYARHNDTNLILVGSTGRSGLSKLLLGSVAKGVVNHSHCPVLIVK